MWQRRSFAWTATSSTAALAAIYDNNMNWGDDFALDDIALVPFLASIRMNLASRPTIPIRP